MPGQQFTLAVVVLSHSEPQQLAALLSALRHPQVRIYLHVDANAEIEPFHKALADAPVGDVIWLRRRRTRWGGIELVDVEIDALSHATQDGCSYFTLISGHDFPLRPIHEIVEFFTDNRARTFLDYTQLPSDRYRLGGRDRTDFYTYTVLGRRETCLPRGEETGHLSTTGRLLNTTLRMRSALRSQRRFPGYLQAFGGELWVNLNRDAMAFTLEFVAAHPDYRRYHAHTLIPDELFVPSVLAGSGFAREHDLVNDDLRYIVWPEPRDRHSHPNVLTLADAAAMFQSPDLFARKVSARDQPELFSELQTRVGSEP